MEIVVLGSLTVYVYSPKTFYNCKLQTDMGRLPFSPFSREEGPKASHAI